MGWVRVGETRKGEGMEQCTLVFADCEPAAREQLFQSVNRGKTGVVISDSLRAQAHRGLIKKKEEKKGNPH